VLPTLAPAAPVPSSPKPPRGLLPPEPFPRRANGPTGIGGGGRVGGGGVAAGPEHGGVGGGAGHGGPSGGAGSSGVSPADADGAWGHLSHTTPAGGYSNFDRGRGTGGAAATGGVVAPAGGRGAGGGRAPGRHPACPPPASPRRAGPGPRRGTANSSSGPDTGDGGDSLRVKSLPHGGSGRGGRVGGASSWEFDEEERPRRLRTGGAYSPRGGGGPISPNGRVS